MVQTKSQKEFRLTKSQMATKRSETSFGNPESRIGILSVGILCVVILSAHPVPCMCSVQLYRARECVEISFTFLLLTMQIEERTDPKKLFCITKTMGVMSVKGAALLNVDHWLLISETP